MPIGSHQCSGLPFAHELLAHPPGHDPVNGAHVSLFLCQGQRGERQHRAEHSFVQAWQLGWLAAGVEKPELSVVLCFSPLLSPSQ